MKEQITFTLRVFELSDEILSVIFLIKILARRNLLIDCIVQWLTRSPDTREIPSSSLGIVIFSFFVSTGEGKVLCSMQL